MAKGDVQQSPWVWTAADYQGLVITISVYFDNSTRLLANAAPGGGCVVIHRDTGCQFHNIVFDVPSSATAEVLAAPADGAADNHYTVAQVQHATKNQPGYPNGWQTWEDTQTVQITAEP